MTRVYIDETTAHGQRLIRLLRENPEAGSIIQEPGDEPGQLDFEPHEDDRIDTIPRDADGNIIGYTVDEVFAKVDHKLSEHYGVDFAKVTKLIDAGVLDVDEITDELLSRPEYKYEPYPSFTPKPLPADFKPDPAMSLMLE
jgi:hypothetical protein